MIQTLNNCDIVSFYVLFHSFKFEEAEKGLEGGFKVEYLNKFLSDIDILTSSLAEVVKKILITSYHRSENQT